MFYAVIDTNVLVSAMLKARSNPGEIVLEAVVGKIIPLINQEILDEYNEVLRRKKFRFKEANVKALLDGITARAIDVEAENIAEVLPDPKDIVFYEVVMEARKEKEAYLITGNLRHFPARTYIVTPAEMLEIIK